MAIGGAASAQGITLFGDARLGLGYNINNDGSPLLFPEDDQIELTDPNGDPIFVDDLREDGDVRAVSRVRFGVRMSGETNSGITFGATIRADNASGGQGGTEGQRSGSVFASGAWGTVTFGDTNGADEQHVGDVNGTGSVTGLGDLNETLYFTNGGELSSDSGLTAAPGKRPTVRYDYNFAGFGLSASTDRDLEDIAVGGSYTFDFQGGSFDIGAGWADVDGRGVVNDITQWSVGIGGTFGDFNAKFIYSDASTDGGGPDGLEESDINQWAVGAGYNFNEWSVNAYYRGLIDAEGTAAGFDDTESYGIGVAYDLGGGAVLAGGIGKSFGSTAVVYQSGVQGDDDPIPGQAIYSGTNEREDAVVADFGIRMSF
jgi:outer membrane protein OmpU